MSASQSYGQALPDQVERLASLSDAQLELLGDVRELYQSRVMIEREYAAKLQALASRAAEKKNKKITALVFGDEPTKAWTEDTIKQSTLNQAYTRLIASFSDSAQDHLNLSDAINAQITEALKIAERKTEEAKKKESKHFQRLLAERDRIYADRAKCKQKYDEECIEAETYRQKQDRAQDDKHTGRAAKQYEQQQIDMHNSKNAYIISTNIANKVKLKFYDEDIPALENQYQKIQTAVLSRFVKILSHAQALASVHYDTLKSRAISVETALGQVSPAKDQNLFIDHNIRAYAPPRDWVFEPCSSHYDTPEMIIEPAPKVVLQNKLVKCRVKLAELHPVLETKRKNTSQLEKVLEAYTENHSLGNPDDVSNNLLDATHDLTAHATSECILLAEIETIDAALGGDEGEQRPHQFKSASFSIPTHCGYCSTSIWGLSKLGKTCKLCSMSVHAKCELKVPAACNASQGVAGSAMKRTGSIATVSRADSKASTIGSLRKVSATPSSFTRVDPPPEEPRLSARVIFEYEATSPYELSVAEGNTVTILEEDDGSGWIKVEDSAGGKGLVPTTYVEMITRDDASAPPPAYSSGQLEVRGVYDYAAAGDDELSIKDGEIIRLTPGPNGGQNYADGWWEGINSAGKKGIFPSNYVTLL